MPFSRGKQGFFFVLNNQKSKATNQKQKTKQKKQQKQIRRV